MIELINLDDFWHVIKTKIYIDIQNYLTKMFVFLYPASKFETQIDWDTSDQLEFQQAWAGKEQNHGQETSSCRRKNDKYSLLSQTFFSLESSESANAPRLKVRQLHWSSTNAYQNKL